MAAASVAITVGVLVLVGWAADVDVLKSVNGPITMKPNAAVALVLSGAALIALVRRWRVAGVLLASIAGAIGAATLSEHLIGWNLRIDQLLFSELPGAAATTSPNRMGPNACISFVLASAALLLLFRNTSRSIAIAQRIALLGGILAVIALSGYVYGAVELYALARYTGIALHTAGALVVIDIGILAARADLGPVAVFFQEGTAGTLLRRLLAPVVLIPFVLGYLVMQGRSADWYDRGLAFTLFAMTAAIALAATVWHTAKVIAASDEERQRAEHERDLLLERERRARGDAESASRLKDHFIATLSHELRTPLNVMLGWTKILESETGVERQARAASVVARNGRLLARLVEDLLDISRVSAGQMEIARQPMSFTGVVQATLDAVAPLAVERGVQVTSELDPSADYVEGDPQRIQQIVWNLLSNALKFTRAGGCVRVSAAANESAVTLSVTDTGIGFDASFGEHLFQPFRQADSSASREYGGLGLGLSIARHIATLHGGTISATSAGIGTGATFVVTLPRSPNALRGSPAPAPIADMQAMF